MSPLVVFVVASCYGLAVVRGCGSTLEGLGYLWVGSGCLGILVWIDCGLVMWWMLMDFGLDRLWIDGGGLWILVWIGGGGFALVFLFFIF